MVEPADLRAAALDTPRALGAPVAQGELRSEPEDFRVEEELGFEPGGGDAHLLLQVRKRNANTQWVAGVLARVSGCRAADVGYAGLKDRRSVAVQWFTVPRPRTPVSFDGIGGGEFEVLAAHPHGRKLPRGALAGNRFVIRVRALVGDPRAIAARVAAIGQRGVPNYFGAQRFGREGANLATSEAAQDARPGSRAFRLSAARSLLFNAVLAQRVAAGSWERLLAGDVAQLEGRGSVFGVSEPDAQLEARCARLEIHPTGALWGRGAPTSAGAVRALEEATAAQFAAHAALLEQAGLRQERRSLRLAVHALEMQSGPGEITLSFRLGRGAFATSVLRELLQ